MSIKAGRGGRKFTRRAMLAGTAALSAAALGRSAQAAMLFPTGEEEAAADVPATFPAPRTQPLSEFGYHQVTILGEQQAAQRENVRSVLMGLNEDSMLFPFRVMSGKPAPGTSLGGWYAWKADYDPHHDDIGFAPGHCFGQWVSALARLSASGDDKAAAARATRLNALLAESIGPGYFEQTRFPAYTYDKLLCGLKDAHHLAGDTAALATLDRLTEIAAPSLPGHAIERETQWRLGKDNSWMWDESYTIAENLYLLLNEPMEPATRERYHKMAQAYLDDATYFVPLAHGENAMQDRHAYSYVNALCSAMQAWLVDGSAMHLEAVRQAFVMLERQSFATGGWGPDELLRKPGTGQVAASIAGTHSGFETPCGSYAHMKLTRYLLRATGNGHYGDSMERVMLNTVLGVLPLEADGRAFYYADYNTVAHRSYHLQRWPCCAGSLPQVVADYGINTWLHEPAAGSRHSVIWVNLYQPSELRWSEAGTDVTLAQAGPYLESGTVRLTVKATRPVAFGLRLRIPGWAGGAPSLRVNGKPAAVAIEQGFTQVEQIWRTGDVVELSLPLALRLEPLPEDPSRVALLWGPLVLFAVRDEADVALKGQGSTEKQTLVATREALLAARRTGPSAWSATLPGGERAFVPFTALGDRPYSTYLRVNAI